MTLKTDRPRMTENEYIVGMLHQIDTKLDQLMTRRPRYVKRFISYGKHHGTPALRDTQVPGRY